MIHTVFHLDFCRPYEEGGGAQADYPNIVAKNNVELKYILGNNNMGAKKGKKGQNLPDSMCGILFLLFLSIRIEDL